jgi:hypothetical protein
LRCEVGAESRTVASATGLHVGEQASEPDTLGA